MTGVGVVNLIISDLCVLEVTPSGLKLLELAPEVSVDEVIAKTGCKVDATALACSPGCW